MTRVIQKTKNYGEKCRNPLPNNDMGAHREQDDLTSRISLKMKGGGHKHTNSKVIPYTISSEKNKSPSFLRHERDRTENLNIRRDLRKRKMTS